MAKKRRRHTVAYKFRVALEAVEGSKTISQLSGEHEVHANLIRAWKRQLLDDGPRVCGGTLLRPIPGIRPFPVLVRRPAESADPPRPPP